MFYKKIATSTDGVFSGPVRIMGVRLVGGSNAATATLFDSLTQATGTGRDFCVLSSEVALEIDVQMFGSNGLTVEKGVSVTLTGTSPVLYIYYA